MRIAENLKTKAMYTPNGLNDKEECLMEYAHLVKRIAHHMMLKLPGSVEVDDLIQAGMMGLLDAASRYDELRGRSSRPMRTRRARHVDELRGADWLPRSMRPRHAPIEAAVSRLQQNWARRQRERCQRAGRIPAGIPAVAAGSARRAAVLLRGFSR
jgi:RNA polymerase sigma factor for flagellar operon FliA